MVFQFEHLGLWKDNGESGKDIIGLKQILSKWQKGLYNKGWNALYIENHDLARIVSTLGDDELYWKESATSLAVMYFLMQGTPFIYQGQEIGMTNVHFKTVEEYQDVQSTGLYYSKLEQGMAHEDIMEIIWATARGNSRTPMQWDETVNGGFSSGTPWLAVNPNYKEINVAQQLADEGSILNFYKKMIQLKKSHDVFTYGEYDLTLDNHPAIYAYTRTLDHEQVLILSNLTGQEVAFELEKMNLVFDQLMLSNYKVEEHEPMMKGTLKPYEARVYRIKDKQ